MMVTSGLARRLLPYTHSMLQILVAIFGLSLLVIVHEAGHYLFARAFGIRVKRLSIGLGTVLVKYQPKGSPTVFQIFFFLMLRRPPRSTLFLHDALPPSR